MVDLSTPWKPRIRASFIEAGPWFTRAVDAGLKPTFRDDPSWTYGALERTLEQTPEAVEPLWDCVLSLWRLRLSVSDDLGKDNLLWVESVLAWQLRHRELIKYFGIEPLQVVSTFAADLAKTEKMASYNLLLFDQLSPGPIPPVVREKSSSSIRSKTPDVTEDVPISGTTPPVTVAVAPFKAGIYTSRTSASVASDRGSEKAVGQNAAPSTDDSSDENEEKGKTVPISVSGLGDVLDPEVFDEDNEEPEDDQEESNATSKAPPSSAEFDLEDSEEDPVPKAIGKQKDIRKRTREVIDCVEVPQKRPRGTKRIIEEEKPNGLDLSKYSVKEWTKLKATLVPEAQIVSCDKCVGSNLVCVAVWNLKGGMHPEINCKACFWKRIPCTFVESDFNISELPQIQRTDEGNQNRADRTGNTQRAKDQLGLIKTLAPTRGSSRRRRKTPSVKEEGTSVAPKRRVTASKGKKKDLGLGLAGFVGESLPSKTVSLTLPALSTYERFLNDPHRSPLTLDEGLLQLEATVASEESFMESLEETIRQRIEIRDDLVGRFQSAINVTKNDRGEGSSKEAEPQE